MNFKKELEKVNSFPDIFELVKEAVRVVLNKSRAGLELGLAEIGNTPQGFLGAYYVGGSNMIVMNQTPLRRIQETNPELMNPYIFTVLLHEYIHSLGFFDEKQTREMTAEVACKAFGKANVVCRMARDINQFFPNLVYPEGSPSFLTEVKLVKDFDKSSIRYIG